MKLLICDNKTIQTFDIPKNIESYHMINFKYNLNNEIYNEAIILRSVQNISWGIISDEKMKLYFGGSECESAVLQDNLQFDLGFADLPELCHVYVVPDYAYFDSFSIDKMVSVNIGSISTCEIKFESTIEEKISLTKKHNVWTISRLRTPTNLTYLNGTTYDVSTLNSGDVIFINGIKIVFLNTILLICSYNKQLTFNHIQQITYLDENTPVTIDPVSDIEKNLKLFSDDQIFAHSPRLIRKIQPETFLIEEPPGKIAQEKQPMLFTLISSSAIFATSALSLLTNLRNFTSGNTDTFTFVLEIATCGIMMVTSVLLPFLTERWTRHTNNKKERLRKKKYKNYLADREKTLNTIIKKQEEILKMNFTPLPQIINNIEINSNEMWSRQIFDDDFLTIQLGTGNIKALVTIDAPKPQFEIEKDELKEKAIAFKEKKNELTNVPIVYNILENKILPIIIRTKFKEDYIKSLMLQLIYYHSGNDLKIIIITSEENEKKWDYMKFLPHNWDKNHEKRFFAIKESDIPPISTLLEQEYEKRLNKNTGDKAYLNFSECYLIVTDNYKLAREIPILDKILDTKENIGISFMIFESLLKNLPSRFPLLVNIDENQSNIVEKDKNSVQTVFAPNYLPDIDILPSARKIANIPISFGGSEASIPNNLSFLEMFGVGRVDQLNVATRWETNNPTTSLKTIIGFRENDNPVELDLHEKFHGPHGLIAGSTGSGKSEFIISYILSLAVNYHPYEVQFVLIDYKGGGLAYAFENRETGIKLPHLIGTITNLDKSEMNRTLVSITSELRRRQQVFNETRDRLGEGTIDIYKYQRLYRDKKVTEPMSHLFIISDEFAELKAQEPDFMDELISAARIGRSLGIHLILATQKPAGVVDDQIWSNTRFRVCLKVQSTEDSSEMLKKPDAAYIKGSGRFYLQVGSDEIYELGQSGWAGAKYVPKDIIYKKMDDNITFLTNDGEVLKTINETVKQSEIAEREYGEQLTNIVKYLNDVATKQELKVNQLWLPNVPETIYYGNIMKKYGLKPELHFINPIIGEYDDPADQKQGYVNLPLSTCGNTFIVGVTGSGRTTLLSTMIYDMIISHNTDEVNIYAIDFGTEKLKIFQNAPQVGEVLTAQDKDKIKFLFYMLKNERDKRLSYYSTNGGDYMRDVQQKKPPFPFIAVFINDVDVFREAYDNLYDYEFAPLTRNCNKVGITFILTSNQVHALGYAVESNFKTKIALNLADITDYSDIFNKVVVPKKNPGRGVIELDNVYEFQVSLIHKEDNIENQVKATIVELGKKLTKKAPRVPVVPDEVTLRMLTPYIKKLNSVPIGINNKTAQVGTYNFDTLLTVASARNNLAAKKFFPRLLEIIGKMEDCKIIVVNAIPSIQLSTEGNTRIKIFESGFKKVIPVINNKVNQLKEVITEEQYFIMFLGYGKLQKSLEKEIADAKKVLEENPDAEGTKPEDIITIDDVIINSKSSSFKYLIYDVDDDIEYISNGKLDTLFKRSNGIWIGKEFDMQSSYDVSNQYSDGPSTNSQLVLIKNTDAQVIKFE